MFKISSQNQDMNAASATKNIKPARVRWLWLDILRGIAVLLVLGHHIGFAVDIHSFREPVRSVCILLLHGGWIGVDLFFVLSGFLVSGLLFEEFRKRGSVNLPRFFVRRGFKIYPAFYTLLLATFAVKLVVQGHLDGRSFLFEALFLQNYGPSLWGHTWSLAVEEHAYLLLGLLIWGLSRGGHPQCFRHLPRIVFITGVLVLGVRVASHILFCAAPGFILHATHCRIDTLLYGVALAYGFHFHREAFLRIAHRYRILFLTFGVTMLSVNFAAPVKSQPWLYTAGLTLNSLAGMMVLTGGMSIRFDRPSWLLRGIARIGFYSYSIYLWHIPVQVWGRLALDRLHPGLSEQEAMIAVWIAACLITGILAARAIELPFLVIRDRFFSA